MRRSLRRGFDQRPEAFLQCIDGEVRLVLGDHVAQRLVGRICESCKAPVEIPPQTLVNLGVAPAEVKEYSIFKGKGCAKCNNTGFKGRVGLYEVMEITDDMRELILIGASALELRKRAIEQGMLTLRRSGLVKIMSGVTTIEEVVRETVL